jgi:hypothetical protein
VGRTKINLVFTKEMFQQIFAERPHIKRAYDKVLEGITLSGVVKRAFGYGLFSLNNWLQPGCVP